jgi:phosphatidylserine/phosphatidylglycerophosphate/cardiolipin synthase-like enzyme
MPSHFTKKYEPAQLKVESERYRKSFGQGSFKYRDSIPHAPLERCCLKTEKSEKGHAPLYTVDFYRVKNDGTGPESLSAVADALKNRKPPFKSVAVQKDFWNPDNPVYPAKPKFRDPWQFLAYFNYGTVDAAELNWLFCMEYGLIDANIRSSGGANYVFKGGEVLYYPVFIAEGKTGPENNKVVIGEPCTWFCNYLPIAENNEVVFYVDGASYVADLYKSIQSAKKEICMTGLHFTGHFNLNRAKAADISDGNDQGALQRLLAEQSNKGGGVNIYLLVNQFWPKEKLVRATYEEKAADLENCSLSRWLKSYGAQPSISDAVLLYLQIAILQQGGLAEYLPMTVKFFNYLYQHGKNGFIHAYTDIHQGYFFHSNHQKTVIIDQNEAYFGGIDLSDIDGDRCDNGSHHPVDTSRAHKRSERNWHDIHACIRKKDKAKVNAVDYIYANFLARYNHGYLQNANINFATESTAPVTPAPLQPGGKGARDYVGKNDWIYPSDRLLEKKKLTPPLVQIVRSMPSGNFDNYEDNQRPNWNKCKDVDFEHSARDAYIVGISAAQKFVYLENQWVADSAIWNELVKKAREKTQQKDNDFYMLIVLPKKFLSAAGFGHMQSFETDFPFKNFIWYIKGLFNYVNEIAALFKDAGMADHFGVYSILQPAAAAAENNGTYTWGKKHWEMPECTWDYMYVHSKLLIVDDKWVLVGSANGGGISLTGILFTSEPDTELSAIVFDDTPGSKVKDLRKRIWKEHLQLDDAAKVDNYIDGAKMFYSKAEQQTYDSFKAPRIHYNLLYYPFSNKRTSDGWGIWKHIKKKSLDLQRNFRADHPDTINQTYYKLSGPLTAVHMMITRKDGKARYKKLVDDIFEKGVNEECKVNIKSTNELYDSRIKDEYPILEVDWMVGSALMDSINWVLDYQGTVDEYIAAEVSANEMITLMTRVIPCEGGVEYLGCEMYGELDAAKEASRILENAQSNGVFVAVKVSTSLFIRENEAACKKDKKAGKKSDLRNTDYWINECGDDFIKLSSDRTYPSYPGAITPLDINNILPGKMFIRLVRPLEYIKVNDKIVKIRMTFWTWGKQFSHDFDADLFIHSVYAFFIGYSTPADKAKTTNKLLTQTKTVQNLSPGHYRDYVHEDADKAEFTVKCQSGELTVETATRKWWTWNWDSSHIKKLKQGETLSDTIKETSKVFDQDNCVRITANTDTTYTIYFKSVD